MSCSETWNDMGSSPQVHSNLVQHGRITCNRCWQNVATNVQDAGPFRLVRDPGHWGSSNPSTLVLGISKGNTQSNAFATAQFDTVAFKSIRPRVLQVLQAVGLLQGETLAGFERRFCKEESEYAFASVVRCSLTGLDGIRRIHTADSPKIIPAFKENSDGYHFTSACVDQHIGRLPNATRRVVLLGNMDAYVERLRAMIGRARGSLRTINKVAYCADGILFVHVAHPSKGNGHFGAFLRGEGTPGIKMNMAREALSPS